MYPRPRGSSYREGPVWRGTLLINVIMLFLPAHGSSFCLQTNPPLTKIPLNHSLSISTRFQTPHNTNGFSFTTHIFDIEDLQPCDVILHLNLLPITWLLKSFCGGHLSTLLAYILATYLGIKIVTITTVYYNFYYNFF